MARLVSKEKATSTLAIARNKLVCRYFNDKVSVKYFTKCRKIVNFFTFAAFFVYFLFIGKKPCILQKLGL